MPIHVRKGGRVEKQWLIIVIVALTLSMCFLLPANAYAATASRGAKVYTLKENVTYSNYDITGDGRSDAIRIVSTKGGYDNFGQRERLAIYVNGEKAFSHQGYAFDGIYQAQILQLKNGKAFLYLSAQFDYDYTICAVMKYSSGKLKTVIDCNRFFGNSFGFNVGERGGGKVKSVSGNSVVMEFNTMSYTAGFVRADFTYKYKNGTLKKSSNTGKVKVGYRKSNTYKAKKSMTTYKSTACKGKKFTIKKGQKVKFVKAYVKGNVVRLQVKVGGKYGWIKCASSISSQAPPFEGLGYAG